MSIRDVGNERVRPACLLAAVLLALAQTGCATGGGSPVESAGAGAAELIEAYAGRWTLDEASSTPQIPNHLEGVPDETPFEDISRNESRQMRRYRRLAQSRRMSVKEARATVEILRMRPSTLILRVEDDALAYVPIPGTSLRAPLDGSETESREGEIRVRTKVGWTGGILTLEHQVVGGGKVRETLEVVGDRLIMTRNVAAAASEQALTLAYDRS